MAFHELKQVIETADAAIMAEDFDSLMDFYSDDATLVVKPGMKATGKAQIRKAFVAIAAYFNNQLQIRSGVMEVIEAGDVALVLIEHILDAKDAEGKAISITRHATHVFRKENGKWLCVIDNSYGTGLLTER